MRAERGPGLVPPVKIPAAVIVDGRWAETIGSSAWSNVLHNRARYAELQALRGGQPNRYEETRYRHGAG